MVGISNTSNVLPQVGFLAADLVPLPGHSESAFESYWKISLDELEKFLRLIISSSSSNQSYKFLRLIRVIGGQHYPSSVCGIVVGCALFIKSMPRNRFVEIKK